jgi:cell shape-determining protein MreD
LGFLTGFIVDLSMQTYGCHTFSTITICYLRSRIEKSSFGINANLPLAMIKGTPLYSRVSFFLSLIAVHSIIYYSFIFFNITLLSTIFLYAFINSIATFIIVWIISRLISNR